MTAHHSSTVSINSASTSTVSSTSAHQSHHQASKLGLLGLSLGALGVVFGDIGTSPLYAVNEIMKRVSHSPDTILGVISLVVWVLILIVCIKYVIFVLRADHDGEGGVFALYSLLEEHHVPMLIFFAALLTAGAGLLLGDGMITPAISVISAVEGLTIAYSGIQSYIIPITVAVLAVLFLAQSKGTAKIGKVFGPVIILWFVAIAILGSIQIWQTPHILLALSPWYAIQFVLSVPFSQLLLVLGSVMLVVTGGEAMYADLGHFGRLPIRLSWFTVVFPALVLNYLGQGAYLLSGQTVLQNNLFFSLVPSPLVVPMVILATGATVIASQALISGAFSLITQAISLGLIPYLRVQHTHKDHEGQIYVPYVNWTLFIGSVTLVVFFETSSRLASAYGLAVSADMVITSICMVMVTHYIWRWSWWRTSMLTIPFLLIESVFLMANSLKLFEGGFVPLGVALAFAVVVRTWRWGRTKVSDTFASYPTMSIKQLVARKIKDETVLPRSVIIMTPNVIDDEDDRLPLGKQVFWERYGVLPKHLVFLTVVFLKTPHARGNRFTITNLYQDKEKGSVQSVQLHFGFMEEPLVEKWLNKLADDNLLHIGKSPKDWLIHVVHERVLVREKLALRNRLRYALFRIIARNSKTADQYFQLGYDLRLSIEVIPVWV